MVCTQDVQGYINLAGKELFKKRLDELFTVELPEDIPGAQTFKAVSELTGTATSLVTMWLISTIT